MRRCTSTHCRSVGYRRSRSRGSPGRWFPREPSRAGAAARCASRSSISRAARAAYELDGIAGGQLRGALVRVRDAVHLQQRLHGQELALGGELAARELAAVGFERGERARRRGRQVAAARVDERDLARQRIGRRDGLGGRGRRDARLRDVPPDARGGRRNPAPARVAAGASSAAIVGGRGGRCARAASLTSTATAAARRFALRACSAQTNVPPPTIENASDARHAQPQPGHGRSARRARDPFDGGAQPVQIARPRRLRAARAAQQHP